jgi:hypothetical protein
MTLYVNVAFELKFVQNLSLKNFQKSFVKSIPAALNLRRRGLCEKMSIHFDVITDLFDA